MIILGQILLGNGAATSIAGQLVLGAPRHEEYGVEIVERSTKR
jgi:hypothetical protein